MSSVSPIVSPLTNGFSVIDSLESRSAASQSAASARKVLDGRSPAAIAQEIDGLFVSMLLKNMRTSMSEEGLFGSDASDTYGGIFDMFMSRHIAQGSPLGIGDMVKAYLTNSEQAEQNASIGRLEITDGK